MPGADAEVRVDLTLRDFATRTLRGFLGTLRAAGVLTTATFRRMGVAVTTFAAAGIRQMTVFGRVLRSTLLGIPGIIAAIGTGATAALGKSLVSASSAFDEGFSRFLAVFKTVEAQAAATANQIAEDFLRSSVDVVDVLADFQDLFVPLGFDRQAGLELSDLIARLTLDLSSFRNLSEEEVKISLLSGLVGETESVRRRFGVFLTAATAEQEVLRLRTLDTNAALNDQDKTFAALVQSIGNTSKELTEQEKVLARLSIIFRDTQDAQGDFVRTQDQFANQFRSIVSTVREFRVIFGRDLQVAILRVVEELGGMDRLLEVIQVGFALASAAARFLINALGGLLGRAQRLIDALGGADVLTAVLRGAAEGTRILDAALVRLTAVAKVALGALVGTLFDIGKLAGEGLALGILQGIKLLGPALLRELGKVAADAGGQFGDAFGLVVDLGIERLTGLKGATAGLRESLEGPLRAAADLLPKLADGLEEATNAAIGTVGDAAGSAVDSIGERFGGVKAELVEQLRGLGDDFARAVGDVGPLELDIQLEASEALQRLQTTVTAQPIFVPVELEEVRITLGGQIEEAQTRLLQSASREAEAIARAYQGAAAGIAEMGPAFLQAAIAIDQGAVEVIETADQIARAYLNSGRAIEEGFSAGFRAALDDLSVFRVSAQAGADSVFLLQDSFAGFITDLRDGENAAENFLRRLSDGLVDIAAQIVAVQAVQGLLGALNIDTAPEKAAEVASATAAAAALETGGAAAGAAIEIGASAAAAALTASAAPLQAAGATLAASAAALSSSAASLAAANAAGGIAGAAAAAEGGVISGRIISTVPVQYYQAGGIARTPQLAVFGEGRGAEAFVPLPDGRTIPVTLKLGGLQDTAQLRAGVELLGAMSLARALEGHSRELEAFRGVVRDQARPLAAADQQQIRSAVPEAFLVGIGRDGRDGRDVESRIVRELSEIHTVLRSGAPGARGPEGPRGLSGADGALLASLGLSQGAPGARGVPGPAGRQELVQTMVRALGGGQGQQLAAAAPVGALVRSALPSAPEDAPRTIEAARALLRAADSSQAENVRPLRQQAAVRARGQGGALTGSLADATVIFNVKIEGDTFDVSQEIDRSGTPEEFRRQLLAEGRTLAQSWATQVKEGRSAAAREQIRRASRR